VRAAGIAVPEPTAVVHVDGAAVVVLPLLSGVVSAEHLATPDGAMIAGRACGAVGARLAGIDPAGLRLPATWAAGRTLRTAARAWAAGLGIGPSGAERARIDGAADRAARDIDAGAAALAHGDLAPVNVLVQGGVLGAVLDLDRARRAHPLYDAAWFAWVTHFHHPDVAGTAWGSFSRAIGRPGQPVGDVSWLWPLLLLERAAEAADDDEQGRWVERLARTLAAAP
jgi:aminoglycoside phosphotransferase (APT) family kinase protein